MEEICKILYVEDDFSTRNLVEQSIGITSGYKVITAENGLQGLEKFRTEKPDIVLTDIMMPRMNGLDMAREIRKLSPDCQIVIMTAFSDNNYLMDAIDIGVDQFVLKPAERTKLLAALDRCCKVIRSRRKLKEQEIELARSKKMESLAILAGGMAHDFNNLLQVILGYISLAQMNCEPDSKIYKMLAIAEKSSNEARILGQRLLSLARGGMPIMQREEIVRLIIDTVQQYEAPSNTTISINSSADPIYTLIDQDLILQLVTNILKNSCEATAGKSGKINVEVTTTALQEDNQFYLPAGHYAQITISDNGRGIPKELLPNVFDPYITTKEMGAAKGSGLGLTICHAIVRKHKGAIKIQSTPETGTTVLVLLPVAESSP